MIHCACATLTTVLLLHMIFVLNNYLFRSLQWVLEFLKSMRLVNESVWKTIFTVDSATNVPMVMI